MATSTEQINDLIQGYTDLKQYFEGQKGRWDDGVSDAQAAYAALAANLKGVVGDMMYFNATVDPDEVNPTNVDGGVFSTIAAAIEAAPSGSVIDLSLLAGKTYGWNTHVTAYRKSIFLRKSGAGANPVIALSALIDGGLYNTVYGLIPRYGTSLSLHSVDVHLPSAKPNPALPWSSGTAFVAYDLLAPVSVGCYGSRIQGDEGLALVSAASTVANVMLHTCEIDGNCFGVKAIDSGVANVVVTAVTLKNGALVTEGGTLGANLLLKS